MRRRSRAHGSTRALRAAALALAAAGCHKDTIVTTRTVIAHVPAACAVDGNGYATYVGLGDFEAGQAQPGPFLRDQGTTLPQLDEQTRELVMSVSESGRQWAGVTPVGASGDVDVLLLPQAQSCALTEKVGATPGQAGAASGSMLAPVGSRLALLTGGTASNVPVSYVVDLDSGVVAPPSRDVQTVRTGASVTAFGAGGLVAGGTSPGHEVQATAEVLDAGSHGFDASLVTLSEARTHHGAVVLADGRTLLVGGASDAAGKNVLSTLDAVDPAGDSANEGGLTTLDFARRDPVVVRLASGRVLVAGGFDGSGAPVGHVELLEPDAKKKAPLTQPIVLPPAQAVTVVALPAGGALAVLAGAGANETWVVDPSGVVEPATPSGAKLGTPHLFDGGGGAPALWTGAAWLQWQPYRASFAMLPTSDATPPDVGDAACTPEPGLAMWLDPGATRLTALRFDTRNTYSPLAEGGALTFATDTAPDRIPASGGISLDAAANELTLGEAGDTVFVTDRTYADVSITMTLPTAQPPVVVLRDEAGNELRVGDVQSCPVAAGGSSVASLDVERRGTAVTWAINGGSAMTCPTSLADGARVSIGLRAGSAPAVVREMFVVRRGSP